jgi:hypothetical protein
MQEAMCQKQREITARRRTLKTIRTEQRKTAPSADGPIIVQSKWKCGGVKISEVVKSIYKSEGGSPVGELSPPAPANDTQGPKYFQQDESEGRLGEGAGMHAPIATYEKTRMP